MHRLQMKTGGNFQHAFVFRIRIWVNFCIVSDLLVVTIEFGTSFLECVLAARILGAIGGQLERVETRQFKFSDLCNL